MSTAIDTLVNEIARLEEARSHKKEEISRMEEEEEACIEATRHQKMPLLSRERNGLRPVFRLPREILTVIFIHNARDHFECNQYVGILHFPNIWSVPSWVNVSYVCTHWRNIALNCPSLWTYHFNISLRWTQELLLRSKQAPLKISCRFMLRPKDGHGEKGVVDTLMMHMDRIQDLRLYLPSAWFPNKLSLCAPRLENLDIHLHEQPPGHIAIICGDTPVLRTLKLFYCPLPWYLLNLSRLSVLSLYYVPIQLDIGGFLGVLSSMQCLTVLKLESALPCAHGFLSRGGLGTSPKIDLPCLVFLSVTAPLSTVVALLSCVNVPLKARLYLILLEEPGCSIKDYFPISSFLAQRFSLSESQSSSGPIIRSVFLRIDGISPSVTFSSLEYDHCPCAPEMESCYSTLLKIRLGTLERASTLTDDDMFYIIVNICCSLPLTGVQTLHISDLGTPLSSAIWREILGHLHGLRYMRLSYGSVPDLSMLSVDPMSVANAGGQANHDQDSTSSQILVPALEEFVLSDMNFIPDRSNRTGLMSRKALSDVLSTRKGLRLTVFDTLY